MAVPAVSACRHCVSRSCSCYGRWRSRCRSRGHSRCRSHSVTVSIAVSVAAVVYFVDGVGVSMSGVSTGSSSARVAGVTSATSTHSVTLSRRLAARSLGSSPCSIETSSSTIDGGVLPPVGVGVRLEGGDHPADRRRHRAVVTGTDEVVGVACADRCSGGSPLVMNENRPDAMVHATRLATAKAATPISHHGRRLRRR